MRLEAGGKAGAPWFFPVAVIFGLAPFSVFNSLSMMSLLAKVKGCEVRDLPELSGFLVALPILFLSMPVFLFFMNCLIYLIPPARRMTENYVERKGRPGFWESQKTLGAIIAWVGLFTLPLVVLGFWL